MKKMRKTALFLLAVLAIQLCSCASDGGTAVANAVTQADEQTTAPVTQSEEERLIAALPEVDYQGEEFIIIAVDDSQSLGTVSFCREEQNGDVFNDFIYNRNRQIEERYNITIGEYRTGGVLSDVKKTVTAGSDDYDMISDWIMNIVSSAPDGLYYDLYDIDALDLSNPWWNQSCIAPLTIADHLFAAFSDMNTQPLDRLAAIFFNQDIVNALDLSSPYEAAMDGSWTMELFLSMCKEAAADTDGDGTRSQGDRFSFVVGVGSYPIWMNAAGQPLVKSDGNDMILNYGTAEGIRAAEKIAEIINDKSFTVYLNEESWGSERFNSGNSLFSEGTIGKLNQYRDLEFNLGILPIPKLNEEQDQYYSMMSNNDMGVSFPTTASDITRSAVIAEALGAYSYKSLHEVYYEITLQDKLTRDEYSPKMLDIIIGSRVMDIGIICESSWGTVISSFFTKIRKSGAEEFASLAASNESKFVKIREKILAKYEGLE